MCVCVYGGVHVLLSFSQKAKMIYIEVEHR